MTNEFTPIVRVLVFFGFITVFAPFSIIGQAISLDPTFGSGGKLTIGFSDSGSRNSRSRHVFQQPSGRIIVYGSHVMQGAVWPEPGIAGAGLTPNGSLDPAFGKGGKTLEWTPEGKMVSDIEPLPNGQFLRLGWDRTGGQGTYQLVRVNTDGSIDGTFSADVEGPASSLAIRSDGKLLLFGTVDYHAGLYQLLRLNPDGTRDTSFGTNGVMPLNLSRIPLDWGIITGFDVLPDNRIVIGGFYATSESYFSGDIAWAARLNENGYYDHRFGINGISRVTIPWPWGRVNKILPQPDGKILLIGHTGADAGGLLLIRLTQRGRPDQSFGTGGMVIRQTAPDRRDAAYGGMLLPDGRIVVVGNSYTLAGLLYDFLVARFSASGELESYCVTPFTVGRHSYAMDAALQSDEKLVVTGYTRNPDTTANGDLFAIARYVGVTDAL